MARDSAHTCPLTFLPRGLEMCSTARAPACTHTTLSASLRSAIRQTSKENSEPERTRENQREASPVLSSPSGDLIIPMPCISLLYRVPESLCWLGWSGDEGTLDAFLPEVVKRWNKTPSDPITKPLMSSSPLCSSVP